MSTSSNRTALSLIGTPGSYSGASDATQALLAESAARHQHDRRLLAESAAQHHRDVDRLRQRGTMYGVELILLALAKVTRYIALLVLWSGRSLARAGIALLAVALAALPVQMSADDLFEIAVMAFDPLTRVELVESGLRAIGVDRLLAPRPLAALVRCSTASGLAGELLQATTVFGCALHQAGSAVFMALR
ncbi:hypothetical protein EMIHUDRAFT_242283 [Emiliania huxleyi CCMP1516]|uniref:Uncharacterized protein n=2 Tax=Emiliania huxleyi TaxID=2903 RepID=A0A0D3J9R8_EMIH1|nr:hypothetical protein EMIHUDRAFT_242283 [Emiliania huxleyi CCMP1516]EOD20253.1 hypothetical protein EMIHUDRAFT_242283 [Emiliania huxleyi CCMP1516]|eukprot:XP_005772682.1 hypothetical protein EMIHUDRAFT_242283 [Emiliania huxleyi CCMP1516]